MSNSEKQRQDTQHAFLVAWGWFAEQLGLIQQPLAKLGGWVPPT